MTEAGTKRACAICNKTDDEVRLQKCPICFRLYCEDCACQMSGRRFCSKFCAEYFFFSEPDD